MICEIKPVCSVSPYVMKLFAAACVFLLIGIAFAFQTPIAVFFVALYVYSFNVTLQKDHTIDILGRDEDWRINEWTPVTDQIRGGTSSCSVWTVVEGFICCFRGKIDPTLLGAGFASERIDIAAGTGKETGLEIEVYAGDEKLYSLNLFTSRDGGTVSYKVPTLTTQSRTIVNSLVRIPG